MAQFIRTKKLTDVAYSPTLAISEATRRAEVDGSIQEISDILYSTANGKGASQVGLENNPYATVQLLADGIKDAAVGFVPLDASVTNAKLATDVKVGSLATLLTTIKTSVVGAINELFNNKANKTQEEWIVPTLQNGWVNAGTIYDTIGYMKDEFGFVHIKGVFKNGTVDAAIFTLPTGYRSSLYKYYPTFANGSFGYIEIQTDGVVKSVIGSNTLVSFPEIIFKV